MKNKSLKVLPILVLMLSILSGRADCNCYAEDTDRTLAIEEEVFVYKDEIYATKMEDGKGGSIVYDPSENTLTLNHYHFKKPVVDGRFMNINRMADEKPLHIILNGTSTMLMEESQRKYDGREASCMDITESKTIIEGTGKLITNTVLTAEDLTIKDCDIEINALNDGIKSGILNVENANVTVTIEKGDINHPVIWLGLMQNNVRQPGVLNVNQSCVMLKSKGYHTEPIMIKMEDTEVLGEPFLIKNINFSNDTIKTNGKGEAVHVCAIVNGEKGYYIFTEDGKEGEFIPRSHMGNEDNHESTVLFVSSEKKKQNESITKVESLIQAIGETTLEKEAAITSARAAYNGLDSLGEKAAYAKAKVSNYQTLLDAEEKLKKLKEEKKKEEPAKDQTDKEITVSGETIYIKTPTIQSLKSKKTSTATITYTKDTECSGYQISYSTNKKFKKSKTKTKTIKNCKTKKKTIKALKSGKRYYFRVREFKKIEGKKYYGNWGKVKKVKIK